MAPPWYYPGRAGLAIVSGSAHLEVAGTPFSSLAASAQALLVLARGEHDAMVSLAELREHSPDSLEVAAAGHNAHVEKPEEIVGLLERLLPKND